MGFVIRTLWRLLCAAALLGSAYFFLVLHSPHAGPAPYTLNMDELRRLAAAVPGPRASEMRVERVAELRFAEAMVMSGEAWRATPIPVYAYQLIFADGSLVIDAAMASTDGVPGFLVNDFDADAYARLNAALLDARQIVVTHEHFDHIGGIFDHPELAALRPALRLTAAQLAHPDRMLPAVPPTLLDDYEPLRYQGLHPLAPGVVLIEAPGHTPGSQMVYVQLADGQELLLIGDVAWQMRNIHAVRERPLFITALVREDRGQVIEQFRRLRELQLTETGLHLVPGHDADVIADLLAQGVLQPGFRRGPSSQELSRR